MSNLVMKLTLTSQAKAYYHIEKRQARPSCGWQNETKFNFNGNPGTHFPSLLYSQKSIYLFNLKIWQFPNYSTYRPFHLKYRLMNHLNIISIPFKQHYVVQYLMSKWTRFGCFYSIYYIFLSMILSYISRFQNFEYQRLLTNSYYR